MRYIKFEGDTCFCGTQFTEYHKFENITDTELDVMASELAYENAESFDYLVYGWGTDAEEYAEANDISIEEAKETMEDYYADAYCNWEEITEEEYREEMGEDA